MDTIYSKTYEALTYTVYRTLGGNALFSFKNVQSFQFCSDF